MTIMSIGLLTGYVMTWYQALKAAPVTLVATVLTLATIITNILSGIFITHSLRIELIYQTILLVAGSWFFVKEVGLPTQAGKHDRTLALR